MALRQLCTYCSQSRCVVRFVSVGTLIGRVGITYKNIGGPRVLPSHNSNGWTQAVTLSVASPTAIHMLSESPKRAASTSPVGDPKRDVKRWHPAKDLWSEEHQQQDAMLKQRLARSDSKPRQFDVDFAPSMAVVLQVVGQVASEDSHLLHTPAEPELTGSRLKITEIF